MAAAGLFHLYEHLIIIINNSEIPRLSSLMADSISIYSFVSKKDCFNNKKLELLQTKHENTSTTTPPAVSFKVIKGSMTANNKFYWSFGFALAAK